MSANRNWNPRTARLVAVLLAIVAYGTHIAACADSALFYFPHFFTESDMHTNLQWAEGIRKQGWTNPQPFHPYVHWMREIAPKEQWEQWWGGPQIYQQSPLYVYLLAGFLSLSSDLIYVHIAQGLGWLILCLAIGSITRSVIGKPWAGVAGFVVAAAYAPFYAHSWMILRDILGWVITALLAVALIRLKAVESEKLRLRIVALTIGLILGVGILSRETFAMIVPVVLIGVAMVLRQSRWMVLAIIGIGTALPLIPLVIRNVTVGAPALSSSNRFAEVFIHGHAAGGHPFAFIVPDESRAILEKSQGKGWPVITETLATHSGVGSLLAHEGSKTLSLLDPFEGYDNLTMAFIEHISPLVRWGLRHWMIIIPGVFGGVLSVVRRDSRHWVLWLLFVPLLASILVGVPHSRYRQSLAILWIPWAVYFAFAVSAWIRAREWKKVVPACAGLVTGWLLSLGPLSRWPEEIQDRPTEYQLAASIYDRLKQPERAAEMRVLIQRKFGAP